MKKIYSLLLVSLFYVISVSAADPTVGLVFNGGQVVVENSDEAFNSNVFTCEAWINAASFAGSSYVISTESWGGTHGNSGFLLRKAENGTTALNFNAGLVGNKWEGITGATSLTASTWYHIAIVMNNLELKLYVNGVLDGSGTLSALMAPPPVPLTIGTCANDFGRRFTGKMADVRFWSVERTPAQIADNMTPYSLTGSETGLVANWKMNEGTGDEIVDLKEKYSTLLDMNKMSWFPVVTNPIEVTAPTVGLVFDGQESSYVDLGDGHPALTGPTVPYTIEAVVNFSEISGGSKYIIASENSGGFVLRTERDQIQYAFGNSEDGGEVKLVAFEPPTLDKWHHIAVAHSLDKVELYVDGVLAAHREITTGVKPGESSVRIGDGPRWTGRLFKGKMGYIRILNYAKTEAQVRDMANTYVAAADATVVAAWNNNVYDATTLPEINNLYPGAIGATVTWFPASGLEEINNSANIKVNLTNTSLEVTNLTNSSLNIAVYNTLGQKVMSGVAGVSNKFSKQLDNFSGIYILKCNAEDGSTFTRKFLAK